MSMLRSILLHLDASPASARRLTLAGELAAAHGARVTALYASVPSVYSVPFAVTDGAAELLPMLQQLDIDRRDEAKALFDRATTTNALGIRWRELAAEPLIPGVVNHALCADLVVLGQHQRDDPLTIGIPADFVASVLIASGRPALVMPYIDTCATIGQDILVAWKRSRESARALTAALPFLVRAACIHLVAEDGDAAGHAGDVVDYLHLHGVKVAVERHTAVSSDRPGEGLLSLAADVGADLLVMGCYGHSRARELVLGGASRTVLASMTLPVLMAH